MRRPPKIASLIALCAVAVLHAHRRASRRSGVHMRHIYIQVRKAGILRGSRHSDALAHQDCARQGVQGGGGSKTGGGNHGEHSATADPEQLFFFAARDGWGFVGPVKGGCCDSEEVYMAVGAAAARSAANKRKGPPVSSSRDQARVAAHKQKIAVRPANEERRSPAKCKRC